MRLLIPLIVIVVVALIVFLAGNMQEFVTLNLGTTSYDEVPLALVIIVSFAIGAGAVALIALIEGAGVRLANRRLRREMRKLDTEVNFFRTQAPAGEDPSPEPEPESGLAVRAEIAGPLAVGSLEEDRAPEPPSAPVYDAGDAIDDTDPYSRSG